MGKYDANGTFVYNYSGTWRYHPYMIGRIATEIYNDWYSTNDSTPLAKFRDQISWIRANEKQFGDHSVWYYNFTTGTRTTDPWWSSLSNAWIIASLLDSYALDGNPIDLEIAWRGMKSFSYALEDHGVMTVWNGTSWYEEEGTNNSLVVAQPSHILNGMLFAMSGAKYMYLFNASGYAKQLFDDGLASVKAHAKEFDLGMWEKYSITNPRANPDYVALHTTQFNWMASETNDTDMRDWGKRSDWMMRLPSIGYSPVNITASSTVSPIGWNSDRLMDKERSVYKYDRYWSGFLPTTLTLDLGSSKPINFIGYIGIGIGTSPKDWTLYTSSDGVDWVLRGIFFNSTDQDKCIAFDNSIQAQYVRFIFNSNNLKSTVVGLDEIIIANLTADDLYEARVSIEDHRFNNVDGRLTGTVPAGTAIRIDGNLTTSASGSNGSYCYSLPNGEYDIEFTYNGSNLNKTIFVKYAWVTYYNVTDHMIFDQVYPTANAGADQVSKEGASVTFDGSLSTDNVGIFNYTWTFNYSGVLKNLYGVAPSFKFNIMGTYNVTLTVRDEAGFSDSDIMTVIVNSSFSDNLLLAAAVILIIAAMCAPWIVISRKRKRERNQRLEENKEPETNHQEKIKQLSDALEESQKQSDALKKEIEGLKEKSPPTPKNE